MKHFTEDDVKRLLPMRAAIDRLRNAFAECARDAAQNQPRRRLQLKTGAILHSLAGSYGKYFGTKVYSTHPKHGAWFTVLLYDAETGRPLAEFEANNLGQIRTGAASGLATELLAPASASRLGIIGTGFQARAQVEAMLAVRKIQHVKVWSRKEARREEFATEVSEAFGVQVEAVDKASDAVADVDILVTATYAKTPVFSPGNVTGPLLINAMGANWPDRAEVPAETVRAADRLVADDLEQCLIEAGDLLLALGNDGWSRVESLAKLVAGETKSPPESGGLVIFKSVGLGLEDVATAAYVYEQASKA